jgi:hypothetical protein
LQHAPIGAYEHAENAHPAIFVNEKDWIQVGSGTSGSLASYLFEKVQIMFDCIVNVISEVNQRNSESCLNVCAQLFLIFAICLLSASI